MGLVGHIVEPDRAAGVVVGEGRGSEIAATGSGALTAHRPDASQATEGRHGPH